MSTATRPVIATPEQWRAKRVELLAKEKELSRVRDELSRERRELPWVRGRGGLRLRHGRGSADPRSSCSTDGASSSSTTSCSAPTGPARLPELLVLDRRLPRDRRPPRGPRTSRSSSRRCVLLDSRSQGYRKRMGWDLVDWVSSALKATSTSTSVSRSTPRGAARTAPRTTMRFHARAPRGGACRA